MRRIAFLLLAVLMLVPPGGIRAQDVPADITVLSILTMAKQEAEKAHDEKARIDLRYWIALSIEKTGQAEAFGAYLGDARKASQQQYALWAQEDETTRFNFEIEAKAKQAFLTGDIEQAKKIIDQCRLTFPPARCKPFEWWGADFLDLMFMTWEREDGRFAAALDRLKAMQWYPPELRALGLIGFGPHLARGDRTIILELKRLAEAAGGIFKSCVVQIGPTPYVPEFGTAAAIRKLACDGQGRAAIEKAMSYENLRLRVSALLVAAEGLAGIPGPAAETLP